MVGYALGIDVVLAKGADEVGAYDGGFGGAEIVDQEVYKPRKKIRGKVGCDRQDGQQPRRCWYFPRRPIKGGTAC